MKMLITFLLAVCAAASLHAYTISAPWMDRTYEYWVNPTNAIGMNEDDVLAAAQRAANNWTDQSHAAVSVRFLGRTDAKPRKNVRDGKNVIGFVDEKNTLLGEAWSWYRYPPGSTAPLDRIEKLEVDIFVYTRGRKFTAIDDSCYRQRYLEDLLTHEIGHALGLGHSTRSKATMYRSIGGNCVMKARSLDEDDIQGIVSLYAAQ